MKISYEWMNKKREIDDAPDNVKDFYEFILKVIGEDNDRGCTKYTFQEWMKVTQDYFQEADGTKGLAAAMEYETDRVKHAEYSGDCTDLSECDVYDIGSTDDYKLVFAAPDADPRELLQYLCNAVEKDTFYRPTVTNS